MSRLQAIEQGLISINPAAFQELCDSFLAIRNRSYRAFSRTGSQSGKQKTTKGTPDTFLLLPNGKFIFVEYSTNVTEGIKKLVNDITKCIDETKTGIPIEEIEEIIICLNFNLNADEVQQLKDVSYGVGIEISIYTQDALAIELQMHHRDLSHQYLGLPLDTGQIVSIERFITEYDKASNGIATPLDNTFLHREHELATFKQAIQDHDFIILTGSPGVGKTKLALEGFKSFLAENLTYTAYCISYKSHTLLDDLYQYFEADKDYLLFVDDANRIDAFGQITGFYKTPRKGKVKIIVTVRDYAFHEMYCFCQEFEPKQIELNKFSDEHITNIIATESFGILNPNYQKEIIRIADGNPRLAIMAALLAKAEQNIYVLHNISDLFEKYFATFVKDNGEFANELNIKCLGLIAFFYTIPYKDKEITTGILSHFEIDYNTFVDAIDKLDKLELIEIRFDHVKVPEQNLATFFFYKALLKDRLLSFPILLNNYFDTNTGRFKECIISANNTFGYENVMSKLLPDLRAHWNEINEFECKATRFLSVFWFYLQTEALDYIYSVVHTLPLNTIESYETKYENNSFSYQKKNEIITLLGEYFRFSTQLADSLELALEYCRRKPEHVPELIHKIREKLLFDYEDENNGFLRQKVLFETIIAEVEKLDTLSIDVFFELTQTFLGLKYHHTKGGRGNSITWYDYPLPNTSSIKELRKSIWQAVDLHYNLQPHSAFAVLEKYITTRFDNDKKILQFDLLHVVDIIKNHFSTDNLKHCRLVIDMQLWCKGIKITSNILDELAVDFNNPSYKLFCKLDWDRYRDKEIYDFDDWREYEKLKEQDIRKNFVLSSKEDVKGFYENFIAVHQITKNPWGYPRTLDYVIDENLNKNFDIGVAIVRIIIETGNKLNYIPRHFFSNQLKNSHVAKTIWDIIKNGDYAHKTLWELAFFDYLSDELIDTYCTDELVQSIRNIDRPCSIYFYNLERYTKIEPKLFLIILEIIVEKNETLQMKLEVSMDFFSTYFNHIETDIELVKKAYIQQESMQNRFDHDSLGFLNILEKSPRFLVQYVETIYTDSNFPYGQTKEFEVIWKLDSIEYHLAEAFDYISSTGSYYGISELCNSFFRNLQSDAKGRAKFFLFDYIKVNFENSERMRMVIDIARHSMQEFFEEITLLFLSLTQDVSLFSQIPWRGTSTSGSGNTILADVEMADWKRIESIISKSKEGMKLIPIKKYLSDKLDYCQRKGEVERQRKFTSGY